MAIARKTKYRPVVLFVYNRLDLVKRSIESLLGCEESEFTKLIIVSDGNRGMEDYASVSSVREYVGNLSGFKSVEIIYRDINYGLAKNIISGLTELFQNYDELIVLEDDIIVGKRFLEFMNLALEYYKSDDRVISVCGYTPAMVNITSNSDVFFGVRSSSWGWATWRQRWENIDWEMLNGDQVSCGSSQRLGRAGSDIKKMVRDFQKGRIDSWAIRFTYYQLVNNFVSVFPVKSLVLNHGIGELATHTKYGRRFTSTNQGKITGQYIFEPFAGLKEQDVSEFRKPHSILNRITDKIYYFLGKLPS